MAVRLQCGTEVLTEFGFWSLNSEASALPFNKYMPQYTATCAYESVSKQRGQPAPRTSKTSRSINQGLVLLKMKKNSGKLNLLSPVP